MKARNYDVFKAVVALVLLAILLWRVLIASPVPAAPATNLEGMPAATFDGGYAPPASGEASAESNQAVEAYPAPAEGTAAAAELPTVAPILPTQPPTAEPAPTASPGPTSTPESTAVPTASPEPVQTAAAETPTPTASEAAPGDCPLALPSRLKIGDTARVTTNLHLRSAAGLANPILLTNLTGTRLAITGGPVCEPYQKGAYLWWQVSRPDGQSGWSAEASSSSRLYFLEPVQ